MYPCLQLPAHDACCLIICDLSLVVLKSLVPFAFSSIFSPLALVASLLAVALPRLFVDLILVPPKLVYGEMRYRFGLRLSAFGAGYRMTRIVCWFGYTLTLRVPPTLAQ